jgi:hypothetical protein
VDANSHPGTLGVLDSHMEATEHGIAWYCRRHLNGRTEETIGNVSQTDSVVLHHARIDEVLKWTMEHLDAYLASADVIIDQRDEPG